MGNSAAYNRTLEQIQEAMKHQRDLTREEEKRQRELAHERELAEIRNQAGAKIVWKGKARELAALIKTQYADGNGNIQANSLRDALTQAAQHFIRPNGKPFEVHSLTENLRNQEEKKTGNPKPRG